jgi:hypothetical protein
MGRTAAGEPSPPIGPLTVPKKYAAGLEMSCPNWDPEIPSNQA